MNAKTLPKKETCPYCLKAVYSRALHTLLCPKVNDDKPEQELAEQEELLALTTYAAAKQG